MMPDLRTDKLSLKQWGKPCKLTRGWMTPMEVVLSRAESSSAALLKRRSAATDLASALPSLRLATISSSSASDAALACPATYQALSTVMVHRKVNRIL